MEKDYKSVDCAQKAGANGAVGKPENEIRTEIVSIEIVDGDTPRKHTPHRHSKKIEIWGTITCLSLVAFVICLVCSAVYGLTVNIVWAVCVSSALLFFSVSRMIFISADEPTDTADEDNITMFLTTPPQDD